LAKVTLYSLHAAVTGAREIAPGVVTRLAYSRRTARDTCADVVPDGSIDRSNCKSEVYPPPTFKLEIVPLFTAGMAPFTCASATSVASEPHAVTVPRLAHTANIAIAPVSRPGHCAIKLQTSSIHLSQSKENSSRLVSWRAVPIRTLSTIPAQRCTLPRSRPAIQTVLADEIRSIPVLGLCEWKCKMNLPAGRLSPKDIRQAINFTRRPCIP
jgi:hypothetical protein